MGDTILIGDLVHRRPRLVVEYEGAHHQIDRQQYVGDIDRYGLMRRAGVPYLQVTRELLAQRYRVVGVVHTELVALGYTGPSPEVGDEWRRLFTRLSALVGPRRYASHRTGTSNGG